jgi:hypothetical protein
MTMLASRSMLTQRRFVTRGVARATHGALPSVRTRRIVLTGGPGSGKSTAASFLAREFDDELWVLPESATLLYRGGLPRAIDAAGQVVAQRAIFSVQRSLEEATELRHPDRVQLCDRCTIDGAAYWPEGPESFFAAMGSTRERELARYDAVVFMHTAARLPAGYERDLDIRTEDRVEAVRLDERLYELYADHPRLVTIESSSSFLDKLTLVRDAVADLVAGVEVSNGGWNIPGSEPLHGLEQARLLTVD